MNLPHLCCRRGLNVTGPPLWGCWWDVLCCLMTELPYYYYSYISIYMVRVSNHRIHVEIDPTLPKALNSCPTYRQKQNAGVITFNIFKDVCGMWNDKKVALVKALPPSRQSNLRKGGGPDILCLGWWLVLRPRVVPSLSVPCRVL